MASPVTGLYELNAFDDLEVAMQTSLVGYR